MLCWFIINVIILYSNHVLLYVLSWPPLCPNDTSTELYLTFLHPAVCQITTKCVCSSLSWVTAPLLIFHSFLFQSLLACDKLNQLCVQQWMNAASVSELRHSPRLHKLCLFSWDLITLNTHSLMHNQKDNFSLSVSMFISHQRYKFISTTSNIQHFFDDQNQCLFYVFF